MRQGLARSVKTTLARVGGGDLRRDHAQEGSARYAKTTLARETTELGARPVLASPPSAGTWA